MKNTDALYDAQADTRSSVDSSTQVRARARVPQRAAAHDRGCAAHPPRRDTVSVTEAAPDSTNGGGTASLASAGVSSAAASADAAPCGRPWAGRVCAQRSDRQTPPPAAQARERLDLSSSLHPLKR